MDGEELGQPLGRNPDRPIDGRCRRAGATPASASERERLASSLVLAQEAGRHQRVVQLVGVARIGRASSRTRAIAAASSAPSSSRRLAAAPRLHRVAPPLLERRIVQEGVRPRVEDLVSEDRRLGRVAGDQLQLAAMDPLEHAAQPVEVHRFFEAVAHRLADERMIRDLAIAGNVLEARRGVGEDRREQILGEHPLQLRRELAAAAARGTASDTVAFQRQRVSKTGASRNACTSTSRVVSGCR